MRQEQARVVVIGGGPAGSTVATLLKKYDPSARILLVERDAFPRAHVGESALPDSNPVLHKLGVLEKIDAAGFTRKGGVTYKWRDDRPIFSESFSRGLTNNGVPDHAWHVDRSRYDTILLDHAREAGVEIWQPCAVTQIVREGDRVTGVVVAPPGGEPCTITAGHVVDCSGQARLVGRLLGLEESEHDLGDLAIYRYYQGQGWPEHLVGTRELSKIFFAATPAGWIWFIPLYEDVVSVGLVTRREFVQGRDLDELFEEQLAHVPEMVDSLRGARVYPPPGEKIAEGDGKPRLTFTVQNWSYSHPRVAGPGWYLAGDAAAFVDPILSSGMMLAHHAGLGVANAIRTEWSHPDVDVGRLHAAYGTYHSDLCEGFIMMARWWYHQRETGVENWWKRAGVLSRRVRSSLVLEDINAFMTFAAGYIADFRFAHVGPAFGREGLTVCIEGLTGKAGSGDPLQNRISDQRHVLQRRYDRAEFEWYLATHVETERWWELPAIRFFRGDELVHVYRPPVGWDAEGTPDTAHLIRVAAALLDAIDDQRSVTEVVRRALAISEDGSSDATTRVGQRLHVMLADLVALQLLLGDGPVARVGSLASPIADRAAIVSRSFQRAEIVWIDGVGFAGKPARRTPEAVFTSASGTQRYRPPFRVREDASVDAETAARAVMAIVASCDGESSIEQTVKRAAQKLRLADERTGRDLVNVVLTDLLSIGAIVAGTA